MIENTIIVVSKLVDATIKEYQPDIEFKLYHSLEELGDEVATTPIRAKILFFTQDVVGATNSSFSYLRSLTEDNEFLNVDKVIYITNTDAPELISYQYLIEEHELDNWSIITGDMTRTFVTEVINGTNLGDTVNVKRKAVYRRPRADYVKEQLKQRDSLQESYADDETDLGGIPDEDIPEIETPVQTRLLSKIFIAGLDNFERSAFTYLAAQYLSRTYKTILVESDPQFHRITEFYTKQPCDAYTVDIEQLFDKPAQAIESIRNCEQNLVIIECFDRMDYDYNFVISLLYYNLMNDFDYILNETDLSAIQAGIPSTVVLPSTVVGTLEVCSNIDKSVLSNCRFIAVDLNYLPDIHVGSGIAISTILNDLFSDQTIVCPIVKITSLLLADTVYDLGSVLGREVLL